MNSKTDYLDAEFEAIKHIYLALESLDNDARSRVLKYIISRLNIPTETEIGYETSDAGDDQNAGLRHEQAEAPKFETFAELFDAANPGSNANMALVAGYWLQVCQGQGDFDGQSANAELKNLGHRIDNITVAMNSLKAQKPSLVIQLRKSGKTQQARKTYKVTPAGIKAVEEMING